MTFPFYCFSAFSGLFAAIKCSLKTRGINPKSKSCFPESPHVFLPFFSPLFHLTDSKYEYVSKSPAPGETFAFFFKWKYGTAHNNESLGFSQIPTSSLTHNFKWDNNTLLPKLHTVSDTSGKKQTVHERQKILNKISHFKIEFTVTIF